MSDVLRCCNSTYVRADDVWRYPWGAEVPGAVDLTIGDLLVLEDGDERIGGLCGFRPLRDAEERWLAGEPVEPHELAVRRRGGLRPHAGDLVVGMMAPELHVQVMMTVEDVADATGVSKATIDTYRYRRELPQPQVIRGRTPLWARPIIRQWLRTRPGSGWRTDVYAAGATTSVGGSARVAVPVDEVGAAGTDDAGRAGHELDPVCTDAPGG